MFAVPFLAPLKGVSGGFKVPSPSPPDYIAPSLDVASGFPFIFIKKH